MLPRRAHFDALYGPADGPNPSPYHPHGGKPVRVPKLFDLALEQLCVSMVERPALDALLRQQQRRRRGSLRDIGANGDMDEVATPPASAAAIWTATPPVELGLHGSTRRYSTDSAPPSPFNLGLHSPAGFSPPMMNRSRSLSLCSKDSPALRPQLYPAGGSRMLLTPSFGFGPSRRESMSSVGSSPGAHASFGVKSVPSSPLWRGGVGASPPRSSRASSATAPRETLDPPEMHLSPIGSLRNNRLSSPPHGESDDGSYLATSALLTAGSLGLAERIGDNLSRQLRLPDAVIQLIFDRMIVEELLNSSNISIFRRSNLARIDFSCGKKESETDSCTNDHCENVRSKFSEEVTDEWLHLLFEGAVRHHQGVQTTLQRGGAARMAKDLNSPMAGCDATASSSPPPASSPLPIPHRGDWSPSLAGAIGRPHLAGSTPRDGEAMEIAASSSILHLISPPHSPQHGSIRSLPFERQRSDLDADQMEVDSVESSPLHHARSIAIPSGSSHSPPPPSLHNALSVTSPSPSVLLYRHAPSLTALNLTGCYQITNRSLQPLQVCLMLTRLNLSGCTQISDELLVCVLANKFYLEELQLRGLRDVTDATVRVLADKTLLRRLHLDSCSITDEGLTTLDALTQLRQFTVGWCGQRVTERGLQWISDNTHLDTLCLAFTGIRSLQFCSQLGLLRELNIAGCQMATSGLASSAQFPALRHAHMSRTSFRELPGAVLHHGLRTIDLSFSSGVTANKLLTQFKSWAESRPTAISAPTSPLLASQSFSSDRVAQVSADAPSPPLELRTLTLESCHLDNRLAAVIGEHFRNLTELNFTDTGVTSTGLLACAPLIHLRILHLNGCQVHDHGLSVLAKFTSLRALYLDCPSVTDNGLGHLRCLAGTLTRLDVFEAAVSEAGLEHILTLRGLVYLELCNGRLTNAGLARIATHLGQLTSLNISQNRRVTDAGLEPLRALQQLVHLNLSGTSVTHKGLSFLHAKPTDVESSTPPPETALAHISLFGCEVRPTSSRMKELPVGLAVGLDTGVLTVE